MQAGITEFPTSHASSGQVGADHSARTSGSSWERQESGKERPACWPGGPHGVLEEGYSKQGEEAPGRPQRLLRMKTYAQGE